MPHYRVNGLGPAWDGIHVEGEEAWMDGVDFVAVHKVTDHSAMLGDRSPSYTLPEYAMFISKSYLEEEADPGIREFDKKNPYGRQLLEGNYSAGNLRVAYSEYEKCLAVTVYEIHDVSDKLAFAGNTYDRTIYSQNYFQDFSEIRNEIESQMKNGDPYDLVFTLKAFKEREING